MKLFAKGVLWAMLAAMSLTSCGGGGGQSTSSGSTGPYIDALAILSNIRLAGSPQYDASVYVKELSFTGTPIADAVITINGTPLTYNATTGGYGGTVQPDSTGKLSLSVIAKGKTYTAIQEAPDTLPILTVPATLYAAKTNTLTWTTNVSSRGLTPTSYHIDTYIPSTTASVFLEDVTGNTAVIPAYTMAAGNSYCISFDSNYDVQSIANTAQYSGFRVSVVLTSVCKVAL
jgi:hypothetical protein